MKILISIVLLFGNLILGFAQTSNTPLTAEFISSGATVVSETPDYVGLFTIKFSITAEGSDIFLSVLNLGSGFNWSLTPNSIGTVQDSTSVVTLNSGGATLSGDFFQINEGNVAVFSLHTLLEPQTSGFYGIELNSLNWFTSPTSLGDSLDLDGFQTDVIFLEVSEVPEPSTLLLGVLGVGALFFFRRRKR